MPFQATTQLEAVNIILSTIGEAPVDSLTGTVTSDASVALTCLNEVTKDFQTEGWFFNTDLNVTLTPDASGIIWLPSNCSGCEVNRGRYPNIKPVMRYNTNGQPFLYDKQNQTSVFTQPLTNVKLTSWLDWVQIPESARRYILIRAARIFADRTVGAETTHQFTAQDEAAALRSFKVDDGETDELNILSSPDTRTILRRSGFGPGFRF